jgi:hypothetical protein
MSVLLKDAGSMPKKSKYPKTRKLASPGENVQFFILGRYKIIKLMDVYGDPS